VFERLLFALAPGLRLTSHELQPYSQEGLLPETFSRSGRSSVSSNQEPGERRVIGFVGVGFDNQDGHKRLTQTEHFFLVGGSQETHERMQGTAIRFAEALRQRGKNLGETPVEEVLEILHESREDEGN
jgi:hypothetical protein